ncbi:MAG: homocysteine S-methyltransferase family protein [Alphaproteobacteria bacterium]
MIDINYFKSVRILDGGMGQELLSKGLQSKGSLWSASALLEEKYHQLVIDAHLNFINAGANVIVTNNFSARRVRMIENKANDQFEYANKIAGELALKAKELSKKNIMIAGSLPAQNDTYVKDERDTELVESGFLDQALCLQQYVDFYYLDVMSSLRECQIALSVTEKIKIPALVGLHIKADGKLPSGEKIYDVINECKKYNILGIILSCVSPEIIAQKS